MAESDQLRVIQLLRAGLDRMEIAALLGVTSAQLHEAITDPEAAPLPAPSGGGGAGGSVDGELPLALPDGTVVGSLITDEPEPGRRRITLSVSAGNGRTVTKVLADARPSVTLPYESFGDDNGLFSFIGTDGGERAFLNPAREGGEVVASLSAGLFGDNPASNAIDRNINTLCHSQGGMPSYLTFDLGEDRSMAINHYTVKQRTDSTGALLGDWWIEGTNDPDGEWVQLHHYTPTVATLGSEYDCALTGLTASYRYLRLNMTANNIGSGHLACGEIEFYGELTLT